MPVWGVCLDDSLVFSTSDTSRKARNLTRDPRCTITTDVADEAVIVGGEESVLSLSADAGLLQRWVAEYQSKYDWETDPSQAGTFRVRPTRGVRVYRASGSIRRHRHALELRRLTSPC